MLGILQERQRVDDAVAAGISTPNQLSARSLSNLLDDRKGAKTKEEVDEVAREYGMDPKLIEELARHVNSPSISMVLPSQDPDEDDRRLVSLPFPSLIAKDLIDRLSGLTRRNGLILQSNLSQG